MLGLTEENKQRDSSVTVNPYVYPEERVVKQKMIPETSLCTQFVESYHVQIVSNNDK